MVMTLTCHIWAEYSTIMTDDLHCVVIQLLFCHNKQAQFPFIVALP